MMQYNDISFTGGMTVVIDDSFLIVNKDLDFEVISALIRVVMELDVNTYVYTTKRRKKYIEKKLDLLDLPVKYLLYPEELDVVLKGHNVRFLTKDPELSAKYKQSHQLRTMEDIYKYLIVEIN